MKTILNERGQLLIIPENTTEVYALTEWCRRTFDGPDGGEIGFILETLDKDGKMSTSAKMKYGVIRGTD